MKRFIEGLVRRQTTLLPECIDDYVDEHNPVRAIDTFIDMLDLEALGFDVDPEPTGKSRGLLRASSLVQHFALSGQALQSR
jgi:hypothetical protein